MENLSKMTLSEISNLIESKEKVVWDLAYKVHEGNTVAIAITQQAEDDLKLLREEKKKRCKEEFKPVVERLKAEGLIPEDK